MAASQRKDPYLAFRFRVELDQQVVAGFSEVGGLVFETELETFREGGVNGYEHRLAGPVKFPSHLTLKRGSGESYTLWSWYQDVVDGRIKRKDVAILLLDSQGDEKQRWTFRHACPVKWTGPNFRAGTAEVAFESLELAHQGFLSV